MAITFAAGQRLTAAALNAFVPKYVVKGSDEGRTTTTSANDAAFAGIAFGAGETWECGIFLDVDGPTASDIKMLWNVTGGTVVTSRRHSTAMGVSGTAPNDALNTSVQARQGSSSVSYGAAPEAGSAPNTVRTSVQERFLVTSPTAGTLTLQWAQASGPSGTVTVRAGSYFVAHRVD